MAIRTSFVSRYGVDMDAPKSAEVNILVSPEDTDGIPDETLLSIIQLHGTEANNVHYLL